MKDKQFGSGKRGMKKALLLTVMTLCCAGAAFCQDILVMKNGSEVEAVIMEIGVSEIKYQRYNNPNGPTYTVLKSDVAQIKYADGQEEIFQEAKAAPSSNFSTDGTGNFTTNQRIATWALNNILGVGSLLIRKPFNFAGAGLVLLAFVLALAGCNLDAKDDDGGTKKNAIPLTEDTWADGHLAASSEEQWFKFTANAATQYIHVNRSTTGTNISVQLYDSKGSRIGSYETSYFYQSAYKNFTRTVTSGQTYYLQVTAGGSSTYKIAFSTMQVTPGAFAAASALTADTWADGNLAASSEEQWFKFTANTATQYIHVNRSTTGTQLYVQLYDSKGSKIGSLEDFGLFSRTDIAFTRTVTSGQTYYLQVTAAGPSTYKIGFNTSTTPPQ